MSDYIPQPGDRIKRDKWRRDERWDVALVEGPHVLVYMRDDHDVLPEWHDLESHPTAGPWVKVETPEPLPERWIALDDSGYELDWSDTREGFDTHLGGLGNLAVVHVWTDADGTDRQQTRSAEREARKTEAIRLRRRGFSRAQIGQRLSVSPKTVTNYLTGTELLGWRHHTPHCQLPAPHLGRCEIRLWACHCPPSHQDWRPMWGGRQCEWCKCPVLEEA